MVPNVTTSDQHLANFLNQLTYDLTHPPSPVTKWKPNTYPKTGFTHYFWSNGDITFTPHPPTNNLEVRLVAYHHP